MRGISIGVHSQKPAAPVASYPTQDLVLLLRKDMGLSMNGSGVSAWADQSGNGYNAFQTTASRQPGIDAGGNVFFGTGKVLTITNTIGDPFQGDTDKTIIVRYNRLEGGGSTQVPLNVSNAALVQTNLAGSITILMGGSFLSVPAALGDNMLALVRHSGGWLARINGAAAATSNNRGSFTDNTTPASVGATNTSGGNPLNGSIAGVFFYNRALTGQDLLDAENFLMGL